MIVTFALLVSLVAPAPSTAVEGVGACAFLAPYAAAYGLDVDRTLKVCWRESRGIPDVINHDDPNGGSFGVMQINAIHLRDIDLHPDKWTGVSRCHVATVDDLLHPIANLCVTAHLVTRAGGWGPWGF